MREQIMFSIYIIFINFTKKMCFNFICCNYRNLLDFIVNLYRCGNYLLRNFICHKISFLTFLLDRYLYSTYCKVWFPFLNQHLKIVYIKFKPKLFDEECIIFRILKQKMKQASESIKVFWLVVILFFFLFCVSCIFCLFFFSFLKHQANFHLN